MSAFLTSCCITSRRSSTVRLLLLKRNGSRITTTTAAISRRGLAAASASSKQQDATSGGEPYQSHEYPWAKEPPIITHTTAKEAAAAFQKDAGKLHQQQPQKSKSSSWFGNLFSKKQTNDSSSTSSSVTSSSSSTSGTSSDATSSSSNSSNSNSMLAASIEAYGDPFDDTGVLSERERSELQEIMKKALPTSLSKYVKPIDATAAPSYIPPNVPAESLSTPETLVTALDNGIRVVSQETYSQVSTVGVVTQLGSRHENSACRGVTNLLESLAFQSTKNYPDSALLHQQLIDWGAVQFANTGREQSLHCIDLLRPNVPKAVGLLGEVFNNALFTENEIQGAKENLSLMQSLPEMTPPELLLGEELQAAAYGTDQQLGQAHLASPESLQSLHRDTVVQYWNSQVLQNPRGLVVGGAGVGHDELVQLTQLHFGHLQQNNDGANVIQNVNSVYRGGSCQKVLPWPKDLVPGSALFTPDMSEAEKDFRLTRVAVALEVGGWHSDDLVGVCVLQTLLGGGSSFSAGGPGKGMYSRLYRRVLNNFADVESAESFTAFHSESGLWGISGSVPPHKARALVQAFCQHLAVLAVQPVDEQELIRARNMLKCNVLTQLESRLVLFEDMARQILTYNKRENIQETCAKIDNVTVADLQEIAARALQKPPTLAAVGIDLSNVPKYEEVVEWFPAR